MCVTLMYSYIHSQTLFPLSQLICSLLYKQQYCVEYPSGVGKLAGGTLPRKTNGIQRENRVTLLHHLPYQGRNVALTVIMLFFVSHHSAPPCSGLTICLPQWPGVNNDGYML